MEALCLYLYVSRNTHRWLDILLAWQVEKICKVANKPLVVTYTGLIQACLEARDIASGSFIFKQMEEYCSPNLVTCNIMLKGYLDHGMFEEAKQLLNRMLEDANHINSKSDYKFRVIPDTYTFNTILDACFEGRRWDDLQYVYQKMLHHGHHFNEKRHLRIVLDSSRAGQVLKILHLLNKIVALCIW